MISRRSTSLIARILNDLGTRDGGSLYAATWDLEPLQRLFYDQDYPEWFINHIKKLHPIEFDDFILSLQIGSWHKKVFFNYQRDALQEGGAVLHKLATTILQIFVPRIDESNDSQGILESVLALIRQLELDGYVFRQNKLIPIEDSVINEQEEHSYLETLVSQLNLSDISTIKHHLGLSEEHFVDGKWDDSISNSRKVLDAILKQITEALHLKIENAPAPAGLLKNAFQTRQYLETKGLITTAEREALDKSYGVLSVTGGHPYIAEKDQARLMRHLALTFSQFVLLRYQGFLAQNP